MPAKKRGLSLDDKRTKMLQLFYEKKTFFQLKELEKIAPKEKGITSMSVKQVVQSLADDGMIDTDKIGVSTYYWAYPSKALITRQTRTSQLEHNIDQIKSSTEQVLQDIETASKGKDDNDQRNQLKKQISELTCKLNKIESELSTYEDCDPDHIKSLQEKTTDLTTATNRWTENIFSIVSFCRNRFNMPEKDIYTQFEIPEEFDYVQ